MRFSGSVSAVSRRALMALGLVTVLGGVAFAQDPAAAQQQDSLKLTTQDNVILMYQIKSERAADFAAGWNEIKAKLSASTNADFKEMGDSINLFTVDLPASPMTLFVFQLKPPSHKISYDPTRLLYYEETKSLWERADADKIYAKVNKDNFAPGSQPVTMLVLKKAGS